MQCHSSCYVPFSLLHESPCPRSPRLPPPLLSPLPSRAARTPSSRKAVSCSNSEMLIQLTPFAVEVATFASGCFWGTEHLFSKYYSHLPQFKAVVGYTGGKEDVTDPCMCGMSCQQNTTADIPKPTGRSAPAQPTMPRPCSSPTRRALWATASSSSSSTAPTMLRL